MQPTYMRSVTFWRKFTSGSDLLKLPNLIPLNTGFENTATPLIKIFFTASPHWEKHQHRKSPCLPPRWLVSQFREVSLEWLGCSLVNATSKPPSRRATELYTFLVLLNTQYGWRALEPLNSIPFTTPPFPFPKVKTDIKRDLRAAEPLQIKAFKNGLLTNTAIKECAWSFSKTNERVPRTTPFVSFLWISTVWCNKANSFFYTDQYIWKHYCFDVPTSSS